MKRILALASVHFFVIAFGATTSLARVRVNAQYMDAAKSKQWRGIVFACSPYCQFLSIRESNEWIPALPDKEMDEKELRYVAQSDPLYPLLVAKLPIYPYVQSQTKAEVPPTNSQAPRLPPAYAKMPFEYGWDFSIGPSFTTKSVRSANSIQSEASPKGSVNNILLRADLMKGTGHSFFGLFWVQHQLQFTYLHGGNYKLPDGTSGQDSGQGIHYQAWITQPHFKMGPHLASLSEGTKFQTDSLTHSSTNWTALTLGWNVLWHRWKFGLDSLLSSKIQDQQSFRQAPFQQTWYHLSIERCSGKTSLVDINFSVCPGLSYTLDHQSSAISNALLSTSSSDLKTNEMNIFIRLQFGDDLWR